MNNGRIRHATETFVNNLISGVKKLIESNTKQIEVLESEIKITVITDVTKSPNEFLQTGKYQSVFNDTPLKQRALLEVDRISSTTIQQTLTYASAKYFRTISDANQNIEWQTLATTTKTDISFPYASEFMDAGIHYVSRITKNSMGECTAYIAVKKKDGTNFEPGIFYTIGTPPVGFRPKYGALGISNPIGKHDVGISYTDIVSIGIQTPVSANILLGTIRWECEV